MSNCPDYKVPNPKKFILKALEETIKRWQAIQDLKQTGDFDKVSTVTCQYEKLNEVLTCIFNIMSTDGCEEILLFETNMTLLGKILNVKISDQV